MTFADWNYSYTKITGKLNKKSKLTAQEVYDLFELLDKLRDTVDDWDCLLSMRVNEEEGKED